jgi:hypothetical protein
MEDWWALHRDLLCMPCSRYIVFIPDVVLHAQGWAAGDISLAAYIQAAVKDKDFGNYSLHNVKIMIVISLD